MTIIAIERYVLIFYPLKPKMTIGQAWMLNATIAIFSIFLSYAGQVGYSYRVAFGTVEYQVQM